MDYILIFKEIRSKLNLTQEQLALKLGINRGAISSIEIGKQKPTLEIISLLVENFNIDANIFFAKNDGVQTTVLEEPTNMYSKKDIKEGNSENEVVHLRSIIQEKDKQLEEKERLIKILLEKRS